MGRVGEAKGKTSELDDLDAGWADEEAEDVDAGWEDPEADDFQMPDRVRNAIDRQLRQVDPELDTEAYWLP